MRNCRCVLVLSSVLLVSAVAAAAQSADAPMSAMQTTIACTVPPTIELPEAGGLQVAGAQDSAPRLLYGPHDLLILDGGTTQDVHLGDRFFLRRVDWFGRGSASLYTIRTIGWIRVVSVNDTQSLASVEHTCTGIMDGDYLVPFEAPAVPADVSRVDTSGELDFNDLGHVGFGDRLRTMGAIGDFMLIDRGSDRGTALGSRFAIYRDVARQSRYRTAGTAALPLAPVGEVLVVAVGPAVSVVRIMAAHNAVERGDFIVPRR